MKQEWKINFDKKYKIHKKRRDCKIKQYYFNKFEIEDEEKSILRKQNDGTC